MSRDPDPSYQQVMRMLDDLYWHVREVEATVARYVNGQGVTWDEIGDAVGTGEENARKRYQHFRAQADGRPKRGARRRRKT